MNPKDIHDPIPLDLPMQKPRHVVVTPAPAENWTKKKDGIEVNGDGQLRTNNPANALMTRDSDSQGMVKRIESFASYHATLELAEAGEPQYPVSRDLELAPRINTHHSPFVRIANERLYKASDFDADLARLPMRTNFLFAPNPWDERGFISETLNGVALSN